MKTQDDNFDRFQYRNLLSRLASTTKGTSLSAVRRRAICLLMSELGMSPKQVSALNLKDFDARKGTLLGTPLSPKLLGWLVAYLKARPGRVPGMFITVSNRGSYRRMMPSDVTALIQCSTNKLTASKEQLA